MESKVENIVAGGERGEGGRRGREGGRGGDMRGQYLRSEKTIVVSTLVCPIHLFRGTSPIYNKHTRKHMCMDAHTKTYTHTHH